MKTISGFITISDQFPQSKHAIIKAKSKQYDQNQN